MLCCCDDYFVASCCSQYCSDLMFGKSLLSVCLSKSSPLVNDFVVCKD